MTYNKNLVVFTLAVLCLAHSTLSITSPFSMNFDDGQKTKTNSLYDLLKESQLKSTPQQCPNSFIMHLVPSGYPFESHTVTTSDGYILTLFRMQGKSHLEGVEAQMESGKPVVLLQHGLVNDASNWLQNGEHDLAFLLANAGFDVWFGNNRGNKFSRRHTSLTPASQTFWVFSFDEMAKYDLTATFHYIRQLTNIQKIKYIGHSQGTSQMFAALSNSGIRPHIAPYLDVFYALAPIVFLNHNRVPVPNYAAYLTHLVKTLATDLHINHLETGTCSWDQSMVNYKNSFCPHNVDQCYKGIKLTDEPSAKNYENWSRAGWADMATPSGASTNCFLHYAQFIEHQNTDSHYFAQFDYGSAGNQRHYGQPTAPKYQLSLIREKVHLWVGLSDTLATLQEAQMIQAQASNAQTRLKTIPNWGHTSFHFAKNSQSVYSQLVSALRSGDY